ncbi:hypothetical protein [[Limnothrix rosea] IAM M-220]|uniref:hypothetical protein n=1 Tax=[Limnothrix rosea] IAM M-220 TaxID=454133 RepID=UPI000963F72E|nr:hypothetical protein [[Limnothrix rosea] IAM M-220]OKH19025.1 hypothetical protein NIES208_03385 [[Limnothrix rosea] IAM M-220]
MALFGLFGGNKNEPQKGDFFLDFEEAQTLGDTEYMKQPKTIKRTFPKIKGQEGKTIISQVSSDKMRNVDPNQVPSRSTSSSSSFSSSFGSASSFSSSSSFGSTSSSSFSSSTPAPKPAAPAPTVQETKAPEPVVEEKKFEPPAPAPKASNQVDTSMDMFRSMAKKIKR